jgi:cell division protein FtsB
VNEALLSLLPGRGPAQPAEDDWDDELEDEAPRGRGPRRNPLAGLTRRHAALAGAGLVAGWVLLIIVGAVLDSSAATERAAALRAENGELARRLEASRREVDLVRSEAYARLEARAYGMGRNGERAFSLQPGAPPPTPIRALGADPRDELPSSPFDDWLELLFGR